MLQGFLAECAGFALLIPIIRVWKTGGRKNINETTNHNKLENILPKAKSIPVSWWYIWYSIKDNIYSIKDVKESLGYKRIRYVVNPRDRDSDDWFAFSFLCMRMSSHLNENYSYLLHHLPLFIIPFNSAWDSQGHLQDRGWNYLYSYTWRIFLQKYNKVTNAIM